MVVRTLRRGEHIDYLKCTGFELRTKADVGNFFVSLFCGFWTRWTLERKAKYRWSKKVNEVGF